MFFFFIIHPAGLHFQQPAVDLVQNVPRKIFQLAADPGKGHPLLIAARCPHQEGAVLPLQMLHPPLCPLRLGEHQPLLRRGQHPTEVEGGVQRRVQNVLCGAGDVPADAVEIIRKRHRPEHLPD